MKECVLCILNCVPWLFMLCSAVLYYKSYIIHNKILIGDGCINVSVYASINHLSYVFTSNYNYNVYV